MKKYILLATVAFGLSTSACATNDSMTADTAPVTQTAPAAPVAAEAPAVAETIVVSEQPPESGGPAMWKLADEDTTIYLLGTFHLLPADHEWRDARIDAAIDASSELVLETDMDPANPAAIAPIVQELGLTPGQTPILERVPADKRDTLAAAIEETGMPMQVFDMMDSWFAGFTLVGVQIQKMGLSAEAGVEHDLRQSFIDAGKSIGQLETPREQLSYLDGLSQEAQDKFLLEAIESPAEFKVLLDSMLAAWTSGDVDAISDTFNEEYEGSEEMMQAMLYRRNAKWTQQLEQRLDTPGTILVAVGAGHLAGDKSVIDMLQVEGMTVTRIH